MHVRAFTTEEADAMLPALRRTLRHVRELFDEARAQHDAMQILDVLWGEMLHEPANPDRGEYVERSAAVSHALAAIERLVADEITARGVRFPPGGIENGLLDFPSTLDGRWVYMCWSIEEPAVAAWHELDGGFAGRRPITPDVARRMGARAAAPRRRAIGPADDTD